MFALACTCALTVCQCQHPVGTTVAYALSPCSECVPVQVDKERATLAQQMAALQETQSSEEARGDAALVSWGTMGICVPLSCQLFLSWAPHCVLVLFSNAALFSRS